MSKNQIPFKNIFRRGLQTQPDPHARSNEAAGDILNMRVVSNGANGYALEDVKGNRVCFKLNPNYQPNRFIKCDKRMYVLSSNTLLPVTSGEIGVVEFDFAALVGNYTPLYNHRGLNFLRTHKLEGVSIPENSKTERIMFWDFNLPPRTFNGKNKIFSTYMAGTVVVGKTYMVVQGSIDYDGTNYGPNEINTTFTATTIGGTSYSDNSIPGYPPLVIEYYDISLLEFSSNFRKPEVDYNDTITGNVKAGMYSFTAGALDAEGGKTLWTPPTVPIPISSSVKTPPAFYDPWEAFHGDGTNQNITSINSGKGIRLKITNIDTKFKTLRIAFIRYISDNISEDPIVFAEVPITSDTMLIDFVSNDGIEQLLIDDITEISTVFLRNKAGAVIDNTFFIGNVVTREDLKFASPLSAGVEVRPKFKKYLADAWSHYFGRDPVNATIGNTTLFNIPGNSAVIPEVWYEYVMPANSTPTNNDFATYNGTDYGPLEPAGSIFQITSAATAVSCNPGGQGQLVPVIAIQQYDGKYKTIPITGDYYDYKGYAMCQYQRGYHKGNEIYPFGLLPFDLKGNPYPVEFLINFVTPNMYDTVNTYAEAIMAQNAIKSTGGFTLGSGIKVNIMGALISNLDFNKLADGLGVPLADLDQYIRGFSIVRAERDPVIVAQGFAAPVIQDTDQNPNILFKLAGTVPNHHSNGGTDSDDKILDKGFFMFSPDINLKRGAARTEIQPGDKVEYCGVYIDFAPHVNTASDFYTQYAEKDTSSGGTSANAAYSVFNYYLGPGGRIPAFFTDTIDIEHTQDLDLGFADVDLPEGTLISKMRAHITSGGSPDNADSITARSRFIYTQNNHTQMVFGITQADVDAGGSPGVSDNSSRPIINYRRNKSSVHASTLESSLAQLQYIPTGHYQPLDADFMSYMLSTTGGKLAGIVNGIEVWGGDTFLALFDVMESVPAVTDGNDGYWSMSTVYALESRVNPGWREGRSFVMAKTYERGTVDNGINIGTEVNQPEDWVYNDAYSSENTSVKFLARQLSGDLTINEYPRRIYNTPQKRDGELIDSFRLPRNYIEVSNQMGAVMHLAEATGNRLVYVQQFGMGFVPINERSSVPDSLGQQLIIAKGLTAERFVNTEPYLGTQHKFSIFEIPGGWMGMDAHKKAHWFLSRALELSVVNITNENQELIYELLTNNLIESDMPLIGQGIHGAYDNKFKEAINIFRFADDELNNLMNIAFSPGLKNYSGRYDYDPALLFNFQDLLLSAIAKDPAVYTAPSDYSEGDEVSLENAETKNIEYYICIKPIAIDEFSDELYPNVDTEHWAYTSSRNDVFVHNTNDINKFYGIVSPTIRVKFTVVGNDDTKYFENFIRLGNRAQWDVIETLTADQAGEDDLSGIDAEEYEYIDGKWFSSVPLSTEGERMTGIYMEVTMTKSMRLNSLPHISKNEFLTLLAVTTLTSKSH